MTKDPDLKICCLSCVRLHAPDDMDVKITTEIRAAVESATERVNEFIAGSPKDALQRARQAEERRSNS